MRTPKTKVTVHRPQAGRLLAMVNLTEHEATSIEGRLRVASAVVEALNHATAKFQPRKRAGGNAS